MSDWFCGRCGKDVHTHSLASSDCIWEPVDSDWLADHDAEVSEKARRDALEEAAAVADEVSRQYAMRVFASVAGNGADVLDPTATLIASRIRALSVTPEGEKR